MNPKNLDLLFIGNSHTYCNDLPLLVRDRAEAAGYACRVTMLAHPDWYLSQHAEGPEARFNILYGHYDYVILQEHAHPFPPEAQYLDAVTALDRMIREAGSVPVLDECWAKKDEPEKQEQMNEIHRRAAERIGALLAPVGENWWKYQESRPDMEMYDRDGAHASQAGSGFAAGVIWEAILRHLRGEETFSAAAPADSRM